MKTVIKALLAVLLTLASLIIWAAGGIEQPHRFRGNIIEYGAHEIASDSQQQPISSITVITWNIGFGYGGGSEGQGYYYRERSEYDHRLQKMAELIKAEGADIVLLQEVDFDADRSHNVDQAAFLAQETGLLYVAYAPSWDANYVPFPYWPTSRQYGKVYSGGAVLSRWPIADNQVDLLPKPQSQPWWYNLFYLFRYTQWVKVLAPGHVFWLANNHLEAFDKDNRQAQALGLAGAVSTWQHPEPLLFYGGDLNSVPASAVKKFDFPGYPDDDYRDDRTLAILNVPGYAELVSEAAYISNEAAYWTFPADAPDRRLDYLFVVTTVTVQNTKLIASGELSDHLPVLTRINLDDSN